MRLSDVLTFCTDTFGRFASHRFLTCSWVVAVVAAAVLAGTGEAASIGHADAAAFARHHRLSIAQARERLDWQQLAPGLDAVARARLREGFGGLWVDDAKASRIQLAIAPPGTRAQARAVVAHSALAGHRAVDIVSVRHSLARLLEVSSWLQHRLATANGSTPRPLAIAQAVDRNAVQVLVPRDHEITPSQRELLREARARFGNAVEVGISQGPPVELSCRYPFCSPPLRGGIRIAPSYLSVEEGCTGAFIGRGRGSDSTIYQLTAGHCRLFYEDVWGTRPGSSGASWHEIGVWRGNYTGISGDAGKYAVADDDYWRSRPWVYRANITDAQAITSDADPFVGQSICTSGAFLGYSSCGRVTAINYVTNVEDGFGHRTQETLTRADYCARPGDSGAPVYAGSVAVGLTTAGWEERCDTVFTRIRAAEDLMNVDIRFAPVCTTVAASRIKIGDMNGDGKDDIFRFTDPADRIGAGDVWRSNGTTFTALGQVNTGFGIAYQDQIADYDGDGDDDVFQFVEEGRVDKWRSNATTYTQLGQIGSSFAEPCETRIADMNGDLKDDILRFTSDGYGYAWLSTGTAYSYVGQVGTGFGRSDQDLIGDMNGDGRDDVFQITPEGNAYAWTSTGTSYTYLGLIGSGFGSAAEVRVGDRDADGDDDLYRFSDAGDGYYWRSNRTSYTSTGLFTSGFGASRKVRIADINGDRKADILWFLDEGAGFAWLGDGTGYTSLGQIGSGFGRP